MTATPGRGPVSARPADGPVTARNGSAGQPECHDDVCVTCSDTATAVTVLRLLDDDMAIVDTGRGEEEVSVALVAVGVGDTILVHAREAIAVVRQ